MKETLVLVGAIVLGGVFAVSTYGHLVDPGRLDRILTGLRLPTRLANVTVFSVAALIVMPVIDPLVGSALAGMYLVGATLVMFVSSRRVGTIPDCGCFPTPQRVDGRYYLRNGALIVLAGLVAGFAEQGPTVVALGAGAVVGTAALALRSVRRRTSEAH